jgi:hypothetical protein
MLIAGASLLAARSMRPVNVTPSSSALQPACNDVHIHMRFAEAWVWKGHTLMKKQIYFCGAGLRSAATKQLMLSSC